jgi:hypothetical protein
LNQSGRVALGLLAVHLFFRPPALDELTDLVADTGHHLNDCLIRLSDFSTEELQNAKVLGPIPDGKTDGPVKALHCRYSRSGEGGIRSHVGNPDQTVVGPNSAR